MRLELEGAARKYGRRRVLGPVDLVLPAGSATVLLGPSGSGKSTLLGLFAGQIAPSAGTVRAGELELGGASRRELRAHRHRLGLVPQGAGLVAQLSVHHNVLATTLARAASLDVLWSALWPTHRQAVGEALEAVGLRDRQWDRAGELSGGEMQRVAVARTLVGEASLVLADEPTAALDPVNAEGVIALLVKQARSRGSTLVVSTHWVSLISTRFDRVVGLRNGRVVLDRAPAEVSDRVLDELYAGSDERR
ncbi:MAG: ATP-binding cassette domain-containing protein [Myxococcota bacterium]